MRLFHKKSRGVWGPRLAFFFSLSESSGGPRKYYDEYEYVYQKDYRCSKQMFH